MFGLVLNTTQPICPLGGTAATTQAVHGRGSVSVVFATPSCGLRLGLCHRPFPPLLCLFAPVEGGTAASACVPGLPQVLALYLDLAV